MKLTVGTWTFQHLEKATILFIELVLHCVSWCGKWRGIDGATLWAGENFFPCLPQSIKLWRVQRDYSYSKHYLVHRKSAKNVADNDYLYGLYNSSYLKELFIYTVQYSISCLLKHAFMKLYNNSKCMEHGGKVVLGAGALAGSLCWHVQCAENSWLYDV